MTHPAPMSVQLYSIRDALTVDQPAALTQLAEIGFTTVEPHAIGRGDPHDALVDARRLRHDLDTAGLTAPWVHARAPLDDNGEPVLDCVAEIGAQVLVIPSPGAISGFTHESFASPAQTRQLGEQLAQAALKAKTRGLRLAYHNHRHEFAPWPDGDLPYDALVEAAGPDITLEIDVYWVQAGGQHPAEVIHRYAPRVGSLHIKDGPARPDVDQVPAGAGVIELRPAIEAADQTEWHVLEFDRCAGDPFELLETSARWLTDRGLSRLGTPSTRGALPNRDSHA